MLGALKALRDWFKLLIYRRHVRRQRKEKGACLTCGKRKTCEPWCWGPKIRSYLWVTIKAHKFSTTRFLWRNFKNELRWAGVEPWHRYE